MAYLIWDIKGENLRTQLDYDPRVEDPAYETHSKVFVGDIDLETDLLCSYKLNAAGDPVENPYAGKTNQQMHNQQEVERKIKDATALKASKLIEIKTTAANKLKDEYSTTGWRHEKASETDLLNGNNVEMTKLANEKKAIRDANNAHEDALKAIDPSTEAGADAVIAFDPTTY